MNTALSYPFAKPELGSVTAVSPEVLWIRMPLPFRLDHVNLWAIKDGDGWAIVDTGIRNDIVESTWRYVLDEALCGARISKVICTHMHADHVGMAGWLVHRFGCELWMTAGEYHGCQALLEPELQAPPAKIEFYRRAGWSDEALQSFQQSYGGFSSSVHPLPSSFRCLSDGDLISIGDVDWKVIVGKGHTLEHACLYCPQLALFISGDQVLPRITSNVSVPSLQPNADPMRDWLASLSKLKQSVSDDALVLPSHNECFRGLHARLDHLRDIQSCIFDELLKLLQRPHRAVDIFECLFGRPITMSDGFLLTMATGESVANLNYLISDGLVDKSIDGAGIAWYQSTSGDM
ncbi:MBL fold metallo-hydrolase [Pseudomonas sp. YH-1]|uniref:MBL fold metallo-hydrolase n=1 Tax=Pseudomonas sp. YH-1 TaxID=3384787 RepID=UPI003F7FEC2C